MKQKHEHFIEAIQQTSETTVLYGCDCGLEFEEILDVYKNTE
jgi:hypothetical protein